ncbi:hypothetical protein GCM10012280_69220 [Wenjunlia tyrosinilytica]|uniref:Uncharacterized protein n=1 Tax=Wenjunlia tyrosinilytica TaxID=1544741 RepID=A0A917ZZR7_9ACTN|nr:hypothetical protein GCM10012280_69220 [Wenjunlia tyrosinilytica]
MLPGSHVRGLYEDKRRRLPFAVRRTGGRGGVRRCGAEFAGYRDPAPVRLGNRLPARPPKPALPEGSYRFSLARRRP